MDRNQIEVYLERLWVGDKAAKFTDGVDEFFLPLSQIEIRHIKDNDFEVVMPEWLAKTKGIV